MKVKGYSSGDEMNLHVPQSIQTAVELLYLAAVPKQIISPSTNSPIIAPSQDNLLGLYKITDNNVFFTQAEAMNLLFDVKAFDGNLPEPEINENDVVRWSGKQIISIILPEITTKIKDFIIEDGIIKKGQIGKGQSKVLLHIIHSDYGYKEAERYLNDLQKIISRYMIRSGFSAGISDLIVHPDLREINEKQIIDAKQDIIEMNKQIHLNIFEGITKGVEDVYETKIASRLKQSTSKIMDNNDKMLSSDNRIKYIVASGSKGDNTNIQQMCSLLDQQKINNKRIPLGFTNRSLPHFTRYDNGIESRGYIVNNFKD